VLLTAEPQRQTFEQPIEIAELGRSESAAWDAFVQQCPQASFFHRAGWKRVIEKSFGHDCHFLYARRGGAIVGVLPLVHIRSRLFGHSLISTGFTVGGGPAVMDPAALAALDERALALADRLDVDYLEYRSRAPLHDDWAQKVGLYVGFRRAIDADPERNMLAIPRKQRAMVRKGIAAGLVSRIDADAETLHHVYAVSVRNLGTPVFAKSYFRNLLEEFGNDVDVVTITKDGAALASVMNFYFRNEVLPYYGGGLTEARPVAANDFMYWEVMRRACERGYRSFDFGRSKVGTGAYSFKKNWGFEPEPWTYEFKLRRGELPDVNPLNPKYRMFVAAWQRMPIALARAIGPLIVRNLG
jgi:FemAB-related protein (PEP-CTERM system-associated)